MIMFKMHMLMMIILSVNASIVDLCATMSASCVHVRAETSSTGFAADT